MSELRARIAKLSPEKRALLALKISQARARPGRAAAALQPDPAGRHEPFALTALQQAYWVGRRARFGMGPVGNHTYIELDLDDVEPARLERAFDGVVRRHGMLRTVVREDGRQQVLPEVPSYAITRVDLREQDAAARAEALAETRAQLSHRIAPAEAWPLFHLELARLPGGRARLFLSIDALLLDAWSVVLLLRELRQRLDDPGYDPPPLGLSFRDLALAEGRARAGPEFQRARAYWRERIPTFPAAPQLPLHLDAAALESPRFRRRSERVSQGRWARLKRQAARRELTPTALLLAAYAEVLALWSAEPRFIINVPRFGRDPVHPEVEQVLGELASFSLLAVEPGRPDETFSARARRLHRQLWEDLEHAACDGVEVLRELAQARGGAGSALAPVVFTSAPEPGSGATLRGAIEALGDPAFCIHQTSQVWLDNHVGEHAGELCIDWDTVEGVLAPGVSDALLEAYLSLLRLLADEPGAWELERAPLRRRLLAPALRARGRAPDAPIPEVLVHALTAEQVAARGEAPALITSTRRLSYAELDALANRWARRLRELGARPNGLVAIVMEKGWEQVVAAHAVLRAGAGYTPLEADLPWARLEQLLVQAEVRIILTQAHLQLAIPQPAGAQVLCLNEASVRELEAGPLEPAAGPDDLAYVLFTSGSTGVPKGVRIAHRGVVNALVQTRERFALAPGDRVLALTNLAHDMSLFDVFGVLGAGGCAVIPDEEARRDPAHWAELMRRERVTLWNSVPAMMEMLLEYVGTRAELLPHSLRCAFLGGDWISVTLPERLQGLVPGVQVVSVGGPTETTLWNIWHPVDRVEPAWASIPYGRPIANTCYRVVDADGLDRPDWVAGEMLVAGVGVAQGYWRDAARTAERFVQDAAAAERLYRTGDLGRFWPDGTLEFLGRIDTQVQIGGRRIELEEVEAALVQLPRVRSAVAAAVGERAGLKRLVGYVVPAAGSAWDPEGLRAALGERLPAPLVPSVFVRLERLPLTPNGKVDRRALPRPEAAGPSVAQPAAEPTRQGRIARIVRETVGLEQLDPAANLLGYGVNSMDMVRIGNALERAFGVRPRIDELFRLQSVAALAEHYEALVGPEGARAVGPTPGIVEDLGAAGELLARYDTHLDPAAREAFKQSQRNLRAEDLGRGGIDLAAPADPQRETRFRLRRSHRRFELRPISGERFGAFLANLQMLEIDGRPKWLYASPGGLYATQLYLHVKPGRVDGVPAGTYYYHPVAHRLVALTPGVELPRDIHLEFVNTPIVDECAFSLFLVADLDAIGPNYGRASLHLLRIEAGIIAHHLEALGPSCGIGLCQIGSVNFAAVRHLFRLNETHVHVHTLLGGRIPAAPGQPPSDDELGIAADLLQRIRDLDPDELRALLDATRRADDAGSPGSAEA